MNFRACCTALAAAGALIGASACDPPGVGDPCTPEVQPTTGTWSYGEVSVETRSLQCRTRTCMVYHFFPAGRQPGEPDWRICPDPSRRCDPRCIEDGTCPPDCCQWPSDSDEAQLPCRGAEVEDFVRNFCRRKREGGAIVLDTSVPADHPNWFCNFDMGLVDLSSPFCTLKCSGAGRTFECPEGFACEEVVTMGGEGMVGSYCVPSRLTDCHPDSAHPGKQDCCQRF